MCPPAIGAQEFFATLTEVMAGTCCAMGNIPSITPAIRLTFQDSTKSAAGWRRSLLWYPLALVILLRFETSPAAPPTLLRLFLTCNHAGLLPFNNRPSHP